MSHPDQLFFLKECVALIMPVTPNASVVEIGSFDVNGSCRSLFAWAAEYVGIDLVDGPGVDVVSSGHDFGESNSYDIVVSAEAMEHNPLWVETFANMVRIAKPGGFVLFTCASRGRIEHGTARTDPSLSPGTSGVGWTYYRNLERRDFSRRLNLDLLFERHLFVSNKRSSDLYFFGIKPSGPVGAPGGRSSAELAGGLEGFLGRLIDQVPNALSPKERMGLLPVAVASRFLAGPRFQNAALLYVRGLGAFGRTFGVRSAVRFSEARVARSGPRDGAGT